LTTSPYWPLHAKWLKSLTIQSDIGLHINLTEGKPLSQSMLNTYGECFPSLSKLMIQSYFRKLNFNVILTEMNAQIDQFEANMGKLPDFIDGHQHVHQLPIIRDSILKIYEKRLKQNPYCFIRCVNDQSVFFHIKQDAYIKRCIIQLSGASALKNELITRKIPHNTSFSGIYNFKHSTEYAQLFITFLKQVKNHGLIMCHPGLASNNSKEDDMTEDTISYSRENEYRYFLSAEFLEACHHHHVILKTGRSFY